MIFSELTKKILVKTGVPTAINRHVYKNHLTILTYHGIVDQESDVVDRCFLQKDKFLDQMKFIKGNFETLKLSDGIEKLYAGNIKAPAIAITFDDGFQNNYDVAFPLLKAMNIPATIFLSTRYINSSDTVWFGRVSDAIANTTKEKIHFEGEEYTISTIEQKMNSSKKIQGQLKTKAPDVLTERCTALIRDLEISPDRSIEYGEPFRMLDNASIREMAESGLIEFGCHTHGHKVLSWLSRTQCEHEISQSKACIENLVHNECTLFAYPNGGLEDIPECPEDILERCKITAAVTTVPGKNDKDTPVSKLKRNGVAAWQSLADFQLMVLGVKELVWRSLGAINR